MNICGTEQSVVNKICGGEHEYPYMLYVCEHELEVYRLSLPLESNHGKKQVIIMLNKKIVIVIVDK